MSGSGFVTPTERSFAAILPYVLPHATTLPDALGIHHIRGAAIEFARATGVLQDAYPLTLYPNATQYNIFTQPEYNIIRVDGVDSVDGDRCGGWEYRFQPLNDLEVLTTVSVATDVSVRLTVAPKQDSNRLDTYLYELHAEDLAYGALARIAAIPNQYYTSSNMTAFYQRQFMLAKNKARVARSAGYSNKPTFMQMGRFV